MNYKFSIVIPYYNHTNFMDVPMKVFNSYSSKVKELVEIVLVDDGSKESALSVIERRNISVPENLKIYRIKEDIFWNVKGARNLGASVSEGKWVLFHDFDHWFDEDNLVKILNKDLEESFIYTFSRRRNGLEVSPHKETHLIRKTDFFDKIGGHDEDFVGIYGGGFRLYYEIAKRSGLKIVQIPEIFITTIDNYRHEDSSCSSKAKESGINDRELRIKKLSGEIPISKKILRFNWERSL